MRRRPRSWLAGVLTPLVMLLAANVAAKPGLEPLRRVDFDRPGSRESSRLTTDAARALMAGDFKIATETAERAAQQDPSNPWAYYVKGQALVAQGRGQQAIEDLDEAAAKFRARRDLWGRSVALWGKARALQMTGQCEPARQAYQDYAELVQRASPKDANRARRVASQCIPPRG